MTTARPVSRSVVPVELTSEAAGADRHGVHELTTNAVARRAVDPRRQRRGRVAGPRGGGGVAARLCVDGTRRSAGAGSDPPGLHPRLLQRVLATQLQADVQMDFDPEGIRFAMSVPLARDATLLNLLY